MLEQLKQMPLSDVELIEKIIIDKKYFTIIVERYSEKLSRYINRISYVNQQDKEDLLQNVFIKIYVNLLDFDKSLSFNSWIYRITHNEVIDFARKQKRKQDKGHIDTDDEFFVNKEGDLDILVGVYRDENKQKIKDAFLKMTPKYREIVYLRFIEGYSYKDISDILQKTESNVTNMIHRGRKEFKKYYDK